MLNWRPQQQQQRRLLFNAHCNNSNAICENFHIPQVDRDHGITKSGPKKRKTDEDHNGKQDDGEKQKKKKKLEPQETEVTVAPKLESRSNSKESEFPAAQKTDYIHVRARRGQATDSHSLAERMRREKISERMKYLQDLVPGCNNITGKASVLDEIINYVQSLQKQVEFLSMKLASVDTLSDCNMQLCFMEKGMNSSCNTRISRDKPSELLNPSVPLVNPLQQTTSTSHNEFGVTMNLLEHAISGPISVPDAFSESYFDVCGTSVWDTRVQEFCNVHCSQGSEYSNPFHLFQAVDGNNPM